MRVDDDPNGGDDDDDDDDVDAGLTQDTQPRPASEVSNERVPTHNRAPILGR